MWSIGECRIRGVKIGEIMELFLWLAMMRELSYLGKERIIALQKFNLNIEEQINCNSFFSKNNKKVFILKTCHKLSFYLFEQ